MYVPMYWTGKLHLIVPTVLSLSTGPKIPDLTIISIMLALYFMKKIDDDRINK